MPKFIDYLETAHTNINNEIDRSDTILGWITGGKWKTSKDIPQLSETGKVTPENLSWLYERITREPDVEYRGGPGGALEAIGSIGKAGALISPTKAPLWKMLGRKLKIPSGKAGATEMSGESILASMKEAMEEASPYRSRKSFERFSGKKISEITEKYGTETSDKIRKKLKDIKKIEDKSERKWEKKKLKTILPIAKMLESTVKPKDWKSLVDPEDIFDYSKDTDLILQHRVALDEALYNAMNEYKKRGTVSNTHYINMIREELEEMGENYLKTKGATAPDRDIKKVLDALGGKTRYTGETRRNLKLDPDDLYLSNVILGKLKPPKRSK